MKPHLKLLFSASFATIQLRQFCLVVSQHNSHSVRWIDSPSDSFRGLVYLVIHGYTQISRFTYAFQRNMGWDPQSVVIFLHKRNGMEEINLRQWRSDTQTRSIGNHTDTLYMQWGKCAMCMCKDQQTCMLPHSRMHT